MGNFTKAANHLTLEEVEKKIKNTVGFWRVQRWMIIRHALVNPKPAKEIALAIGVAKQTVHNLISAYNRYGPKVVETPGKGQRQRAYLTIEEEKDFLEPFTRKAEAGQITVTCEIKKALEKFLGHRVDESTVYRLLKRHRWRKIVPRSYHPKSRKKEQESFKKTSSKMLKKF